MTKNLAEENLKVDLCIRRQIIRQNKMISFLERVVFAILNRMSIFVLTCHTKFVKMSACVILLSIKKMIHRNTFDSDQEKKILTEKSSNVHRFSFSLVLIK